MSIDPLDRFQLHHDAIKEIIHRLTDADDAGAIANALSTLASIADDKVEELDR